jgi:hypothetical protein
MESTQKSEWICVFCLEMTVTGGDSPDVCPLCNVVSCAECGAFVKPSKQFRFCYGCGAIGKGTNARFCRSDSTAIIYAQHEWCRRNIKSGPSREVFNIATSRDSVWLCSPDGSERLLTDEECDALGIKRTTKK